MNVVGEECDDGNDTSGDGCEPRTARCRARGPPTWSGSGA
ncbi:MAG: hypothetical protein FJ137_11910 [Deltaproteobacteria bacterium]|nr:hypothetical protein [Deltaproteobacteria bacterium]